MQYGLQSAYEGIELKFSEGTSVCVVGGWGNGEGTLETWPRGKFLKS